MRIFTGLLMVVVFGVSGCTSILTDPMNRRGKFEDTQEMFTQYMRWGKFEEASQNLLAAAEGGDMGEIKAKFGATAKTCGGCHKPFRKPKEESFKKK